MKNYLHSINPPVSFRIKPLIKQKCRFAFSVALVVASALVFINETSIYAQSDINLHSITTLRQPYGNGDEGYTLDGIRMMDSRIKLESPANFGASGTYPKNIFITDDYSETGSLEVLTSINDIHLFYFGTFNTASSYLEQFTSAELDSVYNWSVRGGKMIIGASANYPFSPSPYFPDILNSRWHFSIETIDDPFTPVLYVPTTAGASSIIFNGPFGSVDSAFQGGGAQGYFTAIPDDALELAVDANGNPTLFLDCKTLDLVLADGDGHNDLGGVSYGEEIITPNDRFWVNTIVYMDSLQGPPAIVQTGNQLSTGEYTHCQWFLNGDSIPGATSHSITMTESGVYRVSADLDCGCNDVSSSDAAFYMVAVDQLHEGSPIRITPSLVGNEGITFHEVHQPFVVLIYDAAGALVDRFSINKEGDWHETSHLRRGTYVAEMRDEKGELVAVDRFLKQ